MSRVFVIVRGVSGSGKSNLANVLSDYYNAEICSADDYFMVDGVYKFDFSKIGAAHQYCYDKAEQMIKDHQSVIIDNTNCTISEMKKYVQLAVAHDYIIMFRYPCWSEKLFVKGKWNTDFLIANQKNHDRVSCSKVVPDEAIIRQANKFYYQNNLSDAEFVKVILNT